MKKLIKWGLGLIEKYIDWGEILRYFIIGVCTTAINIVAFWLFGKLFGIRELTANILAWIVSTIFAFITNSLFVFRVRPENAGELLRFFTRFIGERLFTLGVEELILFVFVTVMKWERMPVKVVAQIIVIALNFLISKLLVFRRKKQEPAAEENNDR